MSDLFDLAKSQGYLDYRDIKSHAPKLLGQVHLDGMVQLIRDMGIEVRFTKADVIAIETNQNKIG